ncbi:MAG: DUF2460 domain-containing protein [Mesorhizobium sp.]
MTPFHDVVFPLAISFGATGGPERRNEIVTLMSGRETRNARFASSVRRYDAGTGLRSADDLYDVLAFFEARRGSLHAFRFADPFDRSSARPGEPVSATDQAIGTGDGSTTAFQLVKIYGEGDDAFVRIITRPVAGSVVVSVNGEALAAGADFTVDGATGLVTLAAPVGAGLPITAGYEFHVPVRFDTDRIEVSLATFNAGAIPSIPLVEVLP